MVLYDICYLALSIQCVSLCRGLKVENAVNTRYICHNTDAIMSFCLLSDISKRVLLCNSHDQSIPYKQFQTCF